MPFASSEVALFRVCLIRRGKCEDANHDEPEVPRRVDHRIGVAAQQGFDLGQMRPRGEKSSGW
jgi:hypothetical protein